MHPGMAAPARVAADAARITAPLLFHVQHDDEVFPCGGQLELFDLIGSPVKRLVTEPGQNAHTTPAAIAGWRTFIADELDRQQPRNLVSPSGKIAFPADVGVLD